MSTHREPPEDLGPAGTRVWNELWSTYSFETHELHRVEEYVRVMDRLHLLRDMLNALPVEELLTYDRTGKPYVHPLESEVNSKARLAANLYTALKLPQVDAQPMSPASLVAQHAGKSRFAQAARKSG